MWWRPPGSCLSRLLCYPTAQHGQVASGTSAQDRLDRPRILRRQWNRPRAEVVVLARIDPQRREDRRRDVAGSDLALGDGLTVGVRLAMHRATLDATAQKSVRPRTGEVIATDVLVDARRAAELAQQHDQRSREQAALLE